MKLNSHILHEVLQKVHSNDIKCSHIVARSLKIKGKSVLQLTLNGFTCICDWTVLWLWNALEVYHFCISLFLCCILLHKELPNEITLCFYCTTKVTSLSPFRKFKEYKRFIYFVKYSWRKKVLEKVVKVMISWKWTRN